jgi:hypothetical protein
LGRASFWRDGFVVLFWGCEMVLVCGDVRC